MLDEEFEAADSYKPNKADWLDGAWSSIGFAEEGARRGSTGVDIEKLQSIGHKITEYPSTPERPPDHPAADQEPPGND